LFFKVFLRLFLRVVDAPLLSEGFHKGESVRFENELPLHLRWAPPEGPLSAADGSTRATASPT
jgi:hypothetical protein